MACSTSSLLPSLSSAATTPVFRSRYRPGNLTVSINRRIAPSAFFPSAGDLRPELDENPAEAIISGEWTQNFSLLSYQDLLAYLRSQQLSAEKNVGSVTPLREVMSTEIRTAKAEQSVSEIAGHFEFVSGLPVVDGDLRCFGVVSKNDCAKATLGKDEIPMSKNEVLGMSVIDEIRDQPSQKMAEEHFGYSRGELGATERDPDCSPERPNGSRDAQSLWNTKRLGQTKDQNGRWILLNSKVGEIMSSPAITLTPEKTVKDAAALMLKMKIHRIPILNKQKQVIGMVTRSDICQALQGHNSA